MRIEETIRSNGSKRVQMFCDEPSRTRQEFKDECDLAKTLKRFIRTPEGLQALQQAQGFIGGRFEDVSEVQDYRSTLDYVKRADEAFMRLPAAIRRRFGNNAAEFLDFVDNPANFDELVKLGLANPRVEKPVEGGSPTPTAG